MEKAALKAAKRELFGSKARFLRREGITPANVYGQGIESLALEIPEKEAELVIKGGTSRIVSLEVEGEKKNRNVVLKNISRHPLKGSLVHIDLYQVNMSHKMTAEIPVMLVGDAPALEYKENFLEHQLNELEVECLPDKLPPHIEVDISSLEEAGQAIHVADLNPGDGITIITPAEYTIVRVSRSSKEEVETGEEETSGESLDAEVEAVSENPEE